MTEVACCSAHHLLIAECAEDLLSEAILPAQTPCLLTYYREKMGKSNSTQCKIHSGLPSLMDQSERDPQTTLALPFRPFYFYTYKNHLSIYRIISLLINLHTNSPLIECRSALASLPLGTALHTQIWQNKPNY